MYTLKRRRASTLATSMTTPAMLAAIRSIVFVVLARLTPAAKETSAVTTIIFWENADFKRREWFAEPIVFSSLSVLFSPLTLSSETQEAHFAKQRDDASGRTQINPGRIIGESRPIAAKHSMPKIYEHEIATPARNILSEAYISLQRRSIIGHTAAIPNDASSPIMSESWSRATAIYEQTVPIAATSQTESRRERQGLNCLQHKNTRIGAKT